MMNDLSIFPKGQVHAQPALPRCGLEARGQVRACPPARPRKSAGLWSAATVDVQLNRQRG